MNSLSSIIKNNYFKDINNKKGVDKGPKSKSANPLMNTCFTSSLSTQSKHSLNSSILQAYYLNNTSKVSFTRNLTKGQNNHLNYLGAQYLGNNKTVFRVYAPLVDKINLQVAEGFVDLKYWEDKMPENCRTIPMKKKGDVFEITVEKTSPDDMYRFEIIKSKNSKDKILSKDPRTFYQPNDTLGWSAIYDNNKYKWQDNKWMSGNDDRKICHKDGKSDYGIPSGMIISEIHLGVLGGYNQAKKEIDNIAKEGICNTVLVMPTAEFLGKYNIGYDETDKFAPESSRGKPDDFKSFIDYAHNKGINLILDVVPNHFGNHGTAVHNFGPAFDEKNHTPWGAALNFNSDHKDYMRHFMVDMMMNWLVNYHIDGLRIDATEKLFSDTTLKLMASEIRNHPETRQSILIPEHLDKTRKLTVPLLPEEIANPQKTEVESEKDAQKLKNMGCDVQYIYDFKNTLIALTTGWQIYDCGPSIKDLETEFKQGYKFYSDFPELRDPPANTNLVYVTAHDELNAFGGARNIPRLLAIKLGLTNENQLTDPDGLNKKPFRDTFKIIKLYIAKKYDELSRFGITKEKFEKAYKDAISLNRLIMGAMFVHPGQKLIFMGDQRGELAPFNYNADIPDDVICGGDDPKIKGRKLKDVLSEQKGYELGEKADQESKLDQKQFTDTKLRKDTLKYTQKLKQLCLENPALNNGNYDNLVTKLYPESNVLHVHRFQGNNEILAVMNFSDNDYSNFNLKSLPDGEWKEVLNSNNEEFGGNNINLNTDKQVSRQNNKINLPKQSIVILTRQNN